MVTLDYLSPIDCQNFDENIYNILCDFDFVKSKKIYISNVASVFDIETSSFYEGEEKRCCMYAWVFGLNGRCIRGRTWDEFLDVIKILKKVYMLNINRRLIIYVHNLSYEFQFFRKYFEWESVFAIEDRKPIYAVTKDGIEFRCSYLLTGYKLEKVAEHLTKYKVNKLTGDLDYNIIHHSKTVLTDKEWGYILHDGLVVMAHIQEEIERLGSIAEIPITKTGYVRNLFRKNCLKGDNRFDYSTLIRCLKMDVDNYKQLKRAFTGGFTHANINYVNKTIKNVHSYDFTSSYPAVMVSRKYPMSIAHKVIIKDEEDLIKKLKSYCCMFDVTFYDICSIVDFENYISISRCANIEHPVVNNGRLVEASKITLTVTEQDFIIISKMYKWDSMDISNFNIYYKGYLPKDFILTLLSLYKKKTELKNVEGMEAEYLNSKENVNSAYGMCVTDPCREDNIYSDNEWLTTEEKTTQNLIKPIEELIEKYNKENRFLYYPWGVWVTAYARANLFSGILEFKNDYIYSDTDSIKVVNIDKHLEYFESYNKQVEMDIKRCLDYYKIDTKMASPKTKEGEIKKLGVWDYEGKYERFKTLGAKRYLTEKKDKKGNINIEITVAGVGKEAGVKYLKYICRNNDHIFDIFTKDLHFPSHYNLDGKDENGSGKLCHTYIDHQISGEVTDYMGNTANYSELSCVHMENTDYTLTLEAAFIKRLQGIQEGCLL